MIARVWQATDGSGDAAVPVNSGRKRSSMAKFQKVVRRRRTRLRVRRRNAPIGGGIKRGVDLFIATVALIGAFPVLVLIGLAIRLQDHGPILYVHPRVGHRGRTFPCMKFRSMVVNSEEVLQRHLAADPEAQLEWESNRKLRKDPRITPVGRFLRRTSLDELPQLLNVFRGEMSIVGPRPVTTAELELYGEAAAMYVSARPGITGLWQVSGRNDVSYERRVALDCEYITKWSIRGDMIIVTRTLPAVIFSKGCY